VGTHHTSTPKGIIISPFLVGERNRKKTTTNAFIARPAGDGVCVVEAAELSHT
jgi:hypothetical protein